MAKTDEALEKPLSRPPVFLAPVANTTRSKVSAGGVAEPTDQPKHAAKSKPGRVFAISLKGIPTVDAQTKARLEAAARNPESQRRDYPHLADD